MAESKFTKGLWRVEKSEAYKDTWRVTADGHRLASLAGDDSESVETQANAELMADAPRMLEVLDTLYDCVDHEKLLSSQLDAYHQARELLAKHGG
jgi:hypothetical protein